MRYNGEGQTKSGRKARAALVLSFLGLGACEGLLDVELPGQITESALYSPSQAPSLVQSAIADIECGYSDFIATTAAGNDDVMIRTTGWWGGAHEFQTAATTTECNTADNSYGWWTPIQKGRYMAERSYQEITAWTVPNKERLLAQSAIYAGVAYNLLGDYFCEVAVERGPLMTPDQTLAEADKWFTASIGHVAASGGDFPIAGGVSTSAQNMAYLLRSRTRFARGDNAGAAADAARIPKGFKAFVTREAGGERRRWNRIVNSHNGSNWNSVLGPVTWWPAANSAPIPFTGYRDLAILPDGRAISTSRMPITAAVATAVPDTRVPVVNANKLVNSYPLWLQNKYRTLDDDMPLANWEEAWLILAEVEGGQKAIDRVNDIRATYNLPRVTYLSAGDAQGIKDMIIEERRRSLFLEGRFWATKIKENLWFPRAIGTTPYPYSYQGGVRMVMPGAAYELNPNLGEAKRGTGCSGTQRPLV